MANYTALTESKARLVPGYENKPAIAGQKLFRRWEHIDATVVDTLIAAITSTVSNPQADGQTYTGTFATNTWKATAADDRSVVVTQELTLINTITSAIGTLQALSPIKEYDNEILTAFSYEEGEADRISWKYLNINPANRAIAMAYSDANLETTVGANGGEYLARKFVIQDDGTATFVIITEGHAWTNETTSGSGALVDDWQVDGYENTEPDGQGSTQYGINATKTESGTGVPIADLQSALDNVTASNGYAMKSTVGRDNKNGSGTVRKSQVLKRGKTDEFRTDWYAAYGTAEEAEVVLWSDLSDTDADLIIADAKDAASDMTTATYAVAPSNHVLKSVRKIPAGGVDSSGDNLFHVRRITYIPRNSGGGWFGGDTGHYIMGYRRPQDNIEVGVEVYWTNSLANAEDFVSGGDVGSYTVAKAEDDLDTIFDVSTWQGELVSTTPVGFDSGNRTIIRRIGQDMYKATRVWIKDSELPLD